MGYGLFTLATAFVLWLEVIISEIFSRATVKFVSETSDWQLVGSVVMRLHLAVSIGTALILFFSADAISALLKEPVLAAYLQLLALDIPLFSLASAQRYVLIGTGGFRQRALMSAGRHVTRLILIIILVELGLSVPGAIMGSIGASVVELFIGSFFVRLSPFRRSSFPARLLYGYAVWLFLYSISMIIYNKMDLFMLKILGGTADQAGIYGAAQNLAIIPSIFAFSFSPLLLSTLSRMLREGDDQGAKELGRDAMRAVIWMLPLGGMAAGAAQEIVVLTFGKLYLSAGSLLALLIFAALSTVMISVTTATLTAAGKPRWTFALIGPLIPLALLGHLLMIPRFGSVGASLTTTVFAICGALGTVLAVYKLWRVLPPVLTLVRSILIGGGAFILAKFLPTPGLLLLFKLPLIVLLIALAFLILGEFRAGEIAFLRSILHRQPGTEKIQHSNNN
jgi:O-antigen/teichoic acid export membrane protein